MKKLTPIFVFSGIAVIGYALYRYYLKQVDFIKDITYQVSGINVISADANRVSLEILTRIYNASNVEATLEQMYLEVFFNGVKVGEVNEIRDILIEPLKSSNISFVFNFNPRLIGQNILNLITLTIAAKDIILDVRGFVKVRSGFVKTTIPFEYKNNLYSLIKRK